MSRVVALLDEESGLGFRLAGVDVRKTSSAEEAGRQVARLLDDPEVRLVILDEARLADLPASVRRAVLASRSPLFVPVPSFPLRGGETGAEEYVSRLMRRAIGFQVRIRR